MSPFSLHQLATNPDVDTIVCCGSGGVGKTTSAAALAVHAAEQGRHVVVLTIDPAKRLAQSLGIGELDNTPKLVPDVGDAAGGSLSAAMLDMKRTFDDVVQAHASPQKAEAILANPFYQAMSTSFAGTSEYMAMEKLNQLRGQSSAEGGTGEFPWDLMVIDTPPSRSALDFLDAPHRLSSFLDGRFIRVLAAPARTSGRLGVKALSSVVGGVNALLGRLIGHQILTDVQTFVAAMDTMFGGFRERAEQTYEMLRGPNTAFVVVAAPDEDALREAQFFTRRLAQDQMPLAAVLVNRVTPQVTSLTEAEVARGELLVDAQAQPSVVGQLCVQYRERQVRCAAESVLLNKFRAQVGDVPLVEVPALPMDVVDVEALHAVIAAAHTNGDDSE